MELSKEEVEKLFTNLKDVISINLSHFTDLGPNRDLILLNEDKNNSNNLIGWPQLEDGTLVLLKISKEILKTYDAEANKDMFRLEIGNKGTTLKGISFRIKRLIVNSEPDNYSVDKYNGYYNDSDDGDNDDPEISAYWDGSNG